MDKIKVNLRYKTLNEINDECLRLEFIKKDGTPNKNAYLCTMLSNFYPYIAQHKVNLKLDKIFENENVSDNCVFIEPTRNSIDVFESLNRLDIKKSLSTTIREIIEKFFSFESDERERIVLSKYYDVIQEKIKNHEEIVIQTYNRFSNKVFQYNFDPFKIVQTKERIFNYVLGKMFAKEPRIVSIRLMKIKAISDTYEKFKFSKDEKRKIESEILKNAPFYDATTHKVVVRFTADGLKKMTLAYKNRPFIESNDGDTYVFQASEYQAMIYFPQFGADAIVISPSFIADKIKNFFYKGYEAYC